MQIDGDGVLAGGIIDHTVENRGQLGTGDPAAREIREAGGAQPDLGGAIGHIREDVVKTQRVDGAVGEVEFIGVIEALVERIAPVKIYGNAGHFIAHANRHSAHSGRLDHDIQTRAHIVVGVFVAGQDHTSVDGFRTQNRRRPGNGEFQRLARLDQDTSDSADLDHIAAVKFHLIGGVGVGACVVNADGVVRGGVGRRSEIAGDADAGQVIGILHRRREFIHFARGGKDVDSVVFRGAGGGRRSAGGDAEKPANTAGAHIDADRGIRVHRHSAGRAVVEADPAVLEEPDLEAELVAGAVVPRGVSVLDHENPVGHCAGEQILDVASFQAQIVPKRCQHGADRGGGQIVVVVTGVHRRSQANPAIGADLDLLVILGAEGEGDTQIYGAGQRVVIRQIGDGGAGDGRVSLVAKAKTVVVGDECGSRQANTEQRAK